MKGSLPLLELRKLNHSFGSVQVLDGVDFEIRPGEIVALLGDNGAGKSTLIKTISGFHSPTAGSMFWEGKPIQFHFEKGPQEARDLGIETVYQDLGLIPTLSISRNFFLGRELTRQFLGVPYLDRAQMAKVALSKLKEIGLNRPLLPTDPVAYLSGGERQSIAICRARYFGAKLLILDEPTSALSLKQTEQVLSYVRQAAQSGLAVIFITHTLAHAEKLVDRFVVLFRGRKVADYSSKDIDLARLSSLITQGEG